ncbi:hypothetical protein BBK36DRAFT_1162742 [Trichoderma citrinoviride]|uniref:Uncharacterized protein n=1 Tax=Trichoderma citrinoviride TaxID=58853 RepID=A0A2T4B0W6_9HYPO|nr:hypothetical protein BBK36DRAFT_1162742 [Trichoderma citrinoviride]PTB62963.1 hypothetical protein BBK36DRAFT_1162742 [Trichoderma citrinoviride]
MDTTSAAASPSSQAPRAAVESIEARNARFDEITKELRSRRLGCTEYMNAIGEILPHLANPAGILTPARFVELADSINFYNPAERKELLPGLEWAVRPWIPVGYEQTTLYRLVPSLDRLVPQSSECPQTSYQVLDTAFLGVNTTVQPREPARPLNRRAPNLSEQSTQSAESDGADAPGFVFHQLGALECVECETAAEMPSTLEQGDDSDDWEPTGFAVVARLSPAGRMDGVYAIYNMNPVDLDTFKREPVTNATWGIPPSSPEEQFSCARIGNKLGDFGFKFELAWTEQVHHPVELVRAVRSSTGGAMRITVDNNYREHM